MFVQGLRALVKDDDGLFYPFEAKAPAEAQLLDN